MVAGGEFEGAQRVGDEFVPAAGAFYGAADDGFGGGRFAGGIDQDAVGGAGVGVVAGVGELNGEVALLVDGEFPFDGVVLVGPESDVIGLDCGVLCVQRGVGGGEMNAAV